MHVRLPSLRGLLRYPLSLALIAAAVGLVVLRPAWAGEIEFEGAQFSVVSWLLLIATVGVAERLIGSGWTLSIAALTSAAGVGIAWAVLSPVAALGEPLAQEALSYQAWTPSVTTVPLLMAISGHLRPPSRRTTRWVIGTVVIALLLTTGHVSDFARAAGAVLGLLLGSVGRSNAPAVDWRPSVQARWRGGLAAVLVVLASALVFVAVLPNATGVLAWIGTAVDPVWAPVAAVLLTVSAVLILRGRLIGLVMGGVVLAGVIAAVVAELIVPSIEGTLDLSSLGTTAAEWQIVSVLSGGLPALAVLLLMLGAHAVLRRSAPTPSSADLGRLRQALRAHGEGTFAHMATWAGNSVWFGADRAAVAYRVRDGVAFTLGDPITDRPGAAVRSFAGFCDAQGWTPVFYSVHDQAAAALQSAGWACTPIGTDALIDVESFSLTGKRRQDLRTAVNRAGRENVSAIWTAHRDLSPRIQAQIESLCAGWAEGKHLPEMGFTLGGLRELTDPDVRLMVVLGADEFVHAVTSWLPRHRDGVLTGWTLDVMRRDRQAMPGAMEFAIVSTIRQAAQDGVASLSLSGTPLAAHEGVALGRATGYVRKLLEPAYGFAALEHFKAKFDVRFEPLWMCYPQPLQLGRIAPALVRVYLPSLRLFSAVRAVRALV